MDKFIVVNDSCEICAIEYIKTETDKLKDMPDDQIKTQAIHRIIHGASRASSKPCISYPCREQMYDNFAFHKICVEHLYKMIDAVKEYELNGKSETA
jgi:hypothetical protein